jgi:allantoinase
MADYDLLLRGGNVVLEDRVERADLASAEGRVVALAASIAGTAREEIDCSALHIFPGVIDSHVHFNEPGRTHWEGLATGSRAVAAGGGVGFFDMPLNSHPPVLDRAGFEAKRLLAEAQSVTDFALWGGLTPLNLDRLGELRDCGVIGLKAFMSASGIEEFPRADEATLRAGMKRAATLGLPVAVHAEDEALIVETTARLSGEPTVGAYLDSRPPRAEEIAIATAIDLARETGCALHIVHVSTPRGLDMVRAARAEGVDVTGETCPHYLVLECGDVAQLGAVAKCAPPLRDGETRAQLVDAVLRGEVDTLGSDHSPSPPEMKAGADFFKIWGGIAGAQHLLPLLLDLWQRHEQRDWPRLARMLSTNVAARFRLPSRSIAIGAEANLALVDLAAFEEVVAGRLHYRHRITPYLGRKLRGKIVRTLLRGQTIARDGQATGVRAGRLITPSNP